jgi:hypothetical protein
MSNNQEKVKSLSPSEFTYPRRFIVRYKDAYGKIRERLLKEKTAEKWIRNWGYRF